MKRGEIWWVDLGEPLGSEPGYSRPAIVVSADRFNRSSIATITVIPLYSNVRHALHPGNVFLVGPDCGLDRDSVANVTQIAAVDRSAALRLMGSVPPSLMNQIDAGLRLALGL